MLKISLRQFYNLCGNVDDIVSYYDFKPEDFKDIYIFVGDPEPNGDFMLQVKYPRYYGKPQNNER